MRSLADRALLYDIANILVLYQATVVLELCPVLSIYVSICFLAISYIYITLGKVLLDKRTTHTCL